MILLLLVLGCGRKAIPEHLRPDPVAAPAAVEVHDLSGALAALLGEDPLARRAQPGPTGRWREIPGGEPLEAWAVLARRPQVGPEEWAALAERNRGTAAVALARGAALAMAEGVLAVGAADADLEREADAMVLAWFTPLVVDTRPPPPDARPPLAWLGTASASAGRAALLCQAERHVLLGWLDGPDIPLAPVAAAFVPGVHDALMAEPAGALLLARGQGARSAERGAAGEAALLRATALALAGAAADRDAEQVAFGRLLAESRAAQGLPEGADPLASLLAAARLDLSANAADNRSAGLALVALTAERLVGHCTPGLCRDFDRGPTLRRAEAWGPDVVPLARAWQIAALKRALDSLEVTLDRPSFASAIPDLLDALLGAGAQGVPASALRRRHPGPQLFLDLTRAAGGADATDATGALAALKSRLVSLCDGAGPLPPALAEPVQRIRARAAR